MWRRFTFLWLILASPFLALAQDALHPKQDVLELKNGWELRGKLTLQDSLVVLVTQDGNRFTFQTGEVKRFYKEKLPRNKREGPQEFVYPSKGPAGLVQVTVLTGSEDFGGGSTPVATADVQMAYGYRFSRWLQTGIGTGVSLYNRGYLMPWYADVRGDLLPTQGTLHYFGRAGYSLPLFQQNTWTDQFGNEREANPAGGLMYEVGFGVKVHTLEGIAWILSLSYRRQDAVFVSIPWRGNLIEDDVSFQRVGINLGVVF
ncbi:MAG: hypothetical protein AAF804_09720 [Bacteroidota bacterium]